MYDYCNISGLPIISQQAIRRKEENHLCLCDRAAQVWGVPMRSQTPKTIASRKAGTQPKKASLPDTGGGAGCIISLFICLFSSPFLLISSALDALLFLTSSAAPRPAKAPVQQEPLNTAGIH